MKKGIVFLIGFLSFLAVSAQQGSSGGKNLLGIRISSKAPAINHSISYKHFFRPDLAVEGLFTFTEPLALGALVEKHQPIGTGPALTWFWGAGAYLGFSGGRNVGLQGAAGLDFMLPVVPFNLSVDWKPELNLTRQFSFEPAAVGVSLRYVFSNAGS